MTVTVNGQSRTFKDGEGITLPRAQGGKQTVTASDVVFVGYGLSVPGHDDYQGKDTKDKVVVWLGAQGPKALFAPPIRETEHE